MDILHLILNNGYNPYLIRGYGGLGYVPPEIKGYGGLGYVPPEIRGEGMENVLVQHNPENQRNDITLTNEEGKTEYYPLVPTQPTSFLWNVLLNEEATDDDKAIIFKTIQEKKDKNLQLYNNEFNKYIKKLPEETRNKVKTYNEDVYHLTGKYSDLFKKYFPKKKKTVIKDEKIANQLKNIRAEEIKMYTEVQSIINEINDTLTKPIESLNNTVSNKLTKINEKISKIPKLKNVIEKPIAIKRNKERVTLKNPTEGTKELIILFNAQMTKNKLIEKAEEYFDLEAPTYSQTASIIKKYEGQIKYGLDLIKKNPTINSDKINNSLNELVDELQIILGTKKKAKIENNELIITKAEKEDKKSDKLYMTLAEQRDTYEIVAKEDWNEFEEDKDNKDLLEVYNSLALGNLQEKYNELINKTYVKPGEFKAKNCDIFEDKFKTESVTKKFLKQIATDFKETDINEFVVIHTETNYDNVTFNGETFSFKKDKYFPMDVLVLIKYNDETIKKYAIELKYYDNIPYYTGIKNPKGNVSASGTKGLPYSFFMEKQLELYNNYKKSKITRLSDLNNMKNKKPYKKEIEELEELLYDEDKFNERFNKNIYGYCVAMKFSKGGFNFQNKKTDANDYNDDSVYKHMEKFNVNQKVVIYNNNGIIDKTIGGRNKEEIDRYKLLKGCEVVYGISFKDAMLGVNWTKKVRNNNKLINNPFYSHHIYKSSYGKYTDSFGIKLEDLKLIK